jgi:hypothetical protein
LFINHLKYSLKLTASHFNTAFGTRVTHSSFNTTDRFSTALATAPSSARADGRQQVRELSKHVTFTGTLSPATIIRNILAPVALDSAVTFVQHLRRQKIPAKPRKQAKKSRSRYVHYAAEFTKFQRLSSYRQQRLCSNVHFVSRTVSLSVNNCEPLKSRNLRTRAICRILKKFAHTKLYSNFSDNTSRHKETILGGVSPEGSGLLFTNRARIKQSVELTGRVQREFVRHDVAASSQLLTAALILDPAMSNKIYCAYYYLEYELSVFLMISPLQTPIS